MTSLQAVVCGNEVEHGKPAPECFLKVSQEAGVAPEDCLVIEDSPAGGTTCPPFTEYLQSCSPRPHRSSMHAYRAVAPHQSNTGDTPAQNEAEYCSSMLGTQNLSTIYAVCVY